MSTARTRLLVTGAGGLVGGRLAELLSRAYEVTAGVRHSPGPAGLPAVSFDLLQPDTFAAALARSGAEAVLHCAVVNVDECQRDPPRAERANVIAPAALARLCRAGGVRLLALSTDFVLGGQRAFSSEADAAVPVLVYGRTKLAGEEAVLREDPGAAILRLPLVCGRGHGPRATASEAVAWALAAGERVRLYRDQHRTPVDPESIARAVERVLQREHRGRFHLGGPERVSRYELGLRVARVLDLPEELLEEVGTEDLPLPAPRPADVSLDITRARRELGWEPRPLDDMIRDGRRERG